MKKLVVSLLVLLSLSGMSSAAKLDRSRPNVYGSHPPTQWNLAGKVTLDHIVKKDGVPTLKVPSRGGAGIIFRSPKFSVKSNTEYTCVADFMGKVWPSTSIRMGVSFFNGGTYTGNGKYASTWMYKKGEEGKWREAVMVFKTSGNTNKALMLMSRFEDSNEGHPTYLSPNIYCHEGKFWKDQADPKIPFNGTKVKVTSDGLFVIDGKPEFLRCMYADNNDLNKAANWKKMANQGFNCNMWAPNALNIKVGAQSGLEYSFLSIAPYYHFKTYPKEQRGWAYGDTSLLEKTLNSIYTDPVASRHLVGYYFDDEAATQYVLMEKIITIIDRLDRDKNGKRQRPIYMLEGNPGTAMQHLHHMDMVGSYSGGDTGGEGSGSYSHQVLKWADGMNRPVVVAQFNRGGQIDPAGFSRASRHGASMIGFWRDTKGDTTRGQGPMRWWNSFPETVKTISKELAPRFSAYSGESIVPIPESPIKVIEPPNNLGIILEK